jgi:hypothetical protein
MTQSLSSPFLLQWPPAMTQRATLIRLVKTGYLSRLVSKGLSVGLSGRGVHF